MIQDLRNDIKKIASPEKAKANAWFFKTGPGEYGEGDQFIGVSVPQQRVLAKKYKDLSRVEIKALFSSPIHEERLIALFILVHQFQKGSLEQRKEIYDFYLSHTEFVNNWDLVDSSAHKIIGQYLIEQEKNGWTRNDSLDVLKKFAHSEILWERRIAIIATLQYINNEIAEPTIVIAEMLIEDKNDLIQKAVGWMLREMGKKCSQEIEQEFLKKHYKTMGRTALRYAIEKFSYEVRQQYLSGRV